MQEWLLLLFAFLRARFSAATSLLLSMLRRSSLPLRPVPSHRGLSQQVLQPRAVLGIGAGEECSYAEWVNLLIDVTYFWWACSAGNHIPGQRVTWTGSVSSAQVATGVSINWCVAKTTDISTNEVVAIL